MPTTPRPIVIAYILAGIGHQRAAEALAQAFQAKGHPAVHLVDVLDYMPAWFRWFYPRLYIFCVHRLPSVWAITFWLTDQAWFEWLTGGARRWGNRRLARRFLRWLSDVQPEVVISTHFLPPEAIGPWKARHLPALRCWTIITDYRPHRWWIAPSVDRYFVGLDETRAALRARGIPEERITISGIPVEPSFHRGGDRAALRAKHHLVPDRLALLVTSGGFGIGPMRRLCQSLLSVGPEVQPRIQALIVAGSNAALQARLTRWAATAPFPLRVIGFTREMHELMAAADLVVTKPGGLTVTEALVVGRPLLLFAPIWGQESGNAEILVRHGLAYLLQHPEECRALLTTWIQQPDILSTMRAKIEAMPRQPAADIIWAQRAS